MCREVLGENCRLEMPGGARLVPPFPNGGPSLIQSMVSPINDGYALARDAPVVIWRAPCAARRDAE
jgi:hypothetical protein